MVENNDFKGLFQIKCFSESMNIQGMSNNDKSAAKAVDYHKDNVPPYT